MGIEIYRFIDILIYKLDIDTEIEIETEIYLSLISSL